MRNHRLISFIPLIAAFASHVAAQTEVGSGSFGFSDGVHPTFSVIIEGADVKYVEGFWRDELKRISKDVLSKKELIGAGALVPQVSPDTVRVLVKADQRKGNPMVTVHVAILSRKGWVGPDSEPRVLAGAERFVEEHGTALRRQIAQEALTKAERILAQRQRELMGLQREKERTEAGIERSKQRAVDAVEDQANWKLESDALVQKIGAARKENAAKPSAEGDKELSDLTKQQVRAEDKRQRAIYDEAEAKIKAEQLALEVKKNLEDQERKAAEVTRQEAVVAQLREKLESIR